MKKHMSTKRALAFQLLSMLVCVSMLVGSTFAWFTDTASTAVNTIQAGNLDVQLLDADGNELGTAPLKWVAKDGRVQSEILWEPGCTYNLESFRIKNNGNLALKYKVVINGLVGSAKLLEAIDFTVSVDGTALVAKDGTSTVATAADLNNFEGTLAAQAVTGKITITGHMKEDAGNEYMNEKIEGISITVYATQDTVEKDSNGNTYDEEAPLDFVSVGTTEELKNVFSTAKAGENVNVSLTGDVSISDATLMLADQNTPDVGDIYIQGNGHTISNTTDGARCIQIANFVSDRKVTISGAKIVSESTATGNNERRGVQIFSVKNATVNLVNCEIEMKSTDYSFAVKIGGTSENVTVNIIGCTLTSANCIESFGTNCTVNITDCVLNSNYAPNATYCGQGIQDKNGTNNTYNVKNTTFNGTNAQPWQGNSTTIINDLGGNVYNTTHETN